MDYRFHRDDARDSFRFDYRGRDGRRRSETYRYVVNAQGQRISLETDPSELARNLIRSGAVQRGRTETGHGARFRDVADRERKERLRPADGIWIDHRTHRVPALSSEPPGLGAVYAVGAMTRGQIIDASMAHSLVLSAQIVCDDLLDAIKAQPL
jgi:hypothetical protein